MVFRAGEEEYMDEQFPIGEIVKIKSVWSHIAQFPIWHYGVVVDNNEVIHFNLDVDVFQIRIVKTSLEKFVGRGSELQKCKISNLHKIFDADEIMKRAYSVLGTDFGGYNLIENNCEHFANWCASGETFSNQIFFSGEDDHSFLRKIGENVLFGSESENIENIIEGYEKVVDFCEKVEDFFEEL